MNLYERRQRLLELLCQRRQDTYNNLASEFNVCPRTIRYDIAALMCSYPIETVSGRYGGVRMASWYQLEHRPERKTLNQKQSALLQKLREQLTGDDLETVTSILVQFSL